MTERPDLYTIEECARTFRLDVDTVIDACDTGTIPTVNIFGNILIKRKTIEDICEHGTANVNSDTTMNSNAENGKVVNNTVSVAPTTPSVNVTYSLQKSEPELWQLIAQWIEQKPDSMYTNVNLKHKSYTMFIKFYSVPKRDAIVYTQILTNLGIEYSMKAVDDDGDKFDISIGQIDEILICLNATRRYFTDARVKKQCDTQIDIVKTLIRRDYKKAYKLTEKYKAIRIENKLSAKQTGAKQTVTTSSIAA